jgi:hypothetical protein
VAIKPRRIGRSWWSAGPALWYQRLYVDPVTGLLCRTDQLPEEKHRRLAARHRLPALPQRIRLTEDRELRRLDGLWYEVKLAPLPEPAYRPHLEVQKRALKPYDRRSPVIDIEVTVRRLATPAVRDVVSNIMVEAGPPIDDEASWRTYRRSQPDRRYAIAKRVLSRRELRQHGLSNAPSDVV